MNAHTAFDSHSARPAAPFGISVMFHGLIATIIICFAILKSPPVDTQQNVIILVPDATPTSNQSAHVIPTIDSHITNPPNPAVQTTQTLAPTPPEASRPTSGPRMTEAEFRAKHGHPKPTNTKPGPQPTPTNFATTNNAAPLVSPTLITAPTFDTTMHASANIPGNASTQNQMDSYFAQLAQCIRQAQEKPEGLTSGLVVRIEFFVSANGNIGAVKVIRSSGNRAFDDSVMKAIRSVTPIGERPDGKSNSKVADFRMRDEGDD